MVIKGNRETYLLDLELGPTDHGSHILVSLQREMRFAAEYTWLGTCSFRVDLVGFW